MEYWTLGPEEDRVLDLVADAEENHSTLEIKCAAKVL